MASGFKSDAQGFLIGEVIENGRDLLRSQQQGIAIWKTIRTDVKAIVRAVGAEVSNNIRLSRPGAAPRAPSVSTRTLGGNFIGGRAVVVTPRGRGAPAQRTAAARTAMSVVVAQPRASNGRFVAGSRPADANGGGGSTSGGGAGRMFGRMNDTLGKIAESLQAADNVDPTINALKEVKDVVSPLGRGLFSLFGRSAERKKEVWYRRILKALTPGTQKAQQQASGGGLLGLGGGGGFLSSLLGTAGGAAGGGLLGALLGRGAGLLKGGGKLLRRVPLLGALVAGGGALASIFGGGDRDEKYRGVGEAGGMLAGGVAGAKLGAVLGSFIAPGIGTAIGGFLGGVGGALLGEKFGAKVGEWTKTLVDADIPGKVVAAWNTSTAFIGAAWDSLAKDAKEAWAGITTKAGEWLDSAKAGLDAVGKTLSDTGNAVNAWIESKTGINVKENVGKAVDKVGEIAGAAWDKTKSAASTGWSAAKDYAAQAGAAALDGVKATASALTPNTVKRAYGAGMDAVGKVGGMFKGAEARAHETGAAYSQGNIGGLDDAQTRALVASTALTESGGGKLDVVNKFGYAGRYQAGAGWLADAGLIKGGASAVKAAMKADGYSREADWGKAGGMTKFLKDDRNWNGGMTYDKYLASASVQDAAFKTNSDAAYQQMLKNGTITTKTSQSEVAGLLKARHLAGLGGAMAVARGGTGAVDANGTSAKKYFNDVALDTNRFDASYRAGTISAGALPLMASSGVLSPVPPTIPKAAEVRDPVTPLNSGAGAGRGAVNVMLPETVGQNVSDRGTAHVVTGGFGGGASGVW